MAEIIEISTNKCFRGWQKVFAHDSDELKCKMNFGVYLPPQAESQSVPVIYWLSGLTCTEANFIQKSGAQRYAAEHGIILIIPDTSPRGDGIPNDEAYDLGMGAGFYVDATEDPWKINYRMYTYVTKELPALVNKNFPVLSEQQSIMGHSMGGHGAIICALKNPGMYKTVSAFAPICNPIECGWGQKAFSRYLGNKDTHMESWKEYDATWLAKKYAGLPLDILIDQGTKDTYLNELMTDNLVTASTNVDFRLTARYQEGYDHSYFFIATFIEDHIKHHVKYLKTDERQS